MVEFKENDTSTEDIEIYLYQQLVQKRKKNTCQANNSIQSSVGFSPLSCLLAICWISRGLVAQRVKHLPAMWESRVRSLGLEGQPIPVLLPGESHRRRSLVGYSPRGRRELDKTERLHSLFFSFTMAWSASGWGETWDNTKIKSLRSFLPVDSLLQVAALTGRKHMSYFPVVSAFNRLSTRAAKIIGENTRSPACIYSIRLFAVNSLSHSLPDR